MLGLRLRGESRAVDTHIKRLREKLGDYAECIKTVIKAGYRLEGDDEKISKGYRIASALFLIWAIVDFRNYATIGKDLVAYYSGESIIWELVQDKLFQGIVKVVLAVAIIVVGLIRARKETAYRSDSYYLPTFPRIVCNLGSRNVLLDLRYC